MIPATFSSTKLFLGIPYFPFLTSRPTFPGQTFPANSFPCCYKTHLASVTHECVRAMGTQDALMGAAEEQGSGMEPKPYPVPKKSHLPSPSWVCPKPATAATAGSMQGTAGPVSYRHCIPKGCCSMGGVHGFIKQPELLKLQLLKGQTPASSFHRKCSVCLFGPLQPRNLLCLSTQSYKPTARVTGALQG